MTSDIVADKQENIHNETEPRQPGRYLNWKSSF